MSCKEIHLSPSTLSSLQRTPSVSALTNFSLQEARMSWHWKKCGKKQNGKPGKNDAHALHLTEFFWCQAARALYQIHLENIGIGNRLWYFRKLFWHHTTIPSYHHTILPTPVNQDVKMSDQQFFHFHPERSLQNKGKCGEESNLCCSPWLTTWHHSTVYSQTD